MLKQETVILSKEAALAAAQQLGIEPNRLSKLLDISEASGKNSKGGQGLGDGQKEQVRWLAQPYSISFLSAALQDENLFFTTILAGEEDYAFYGDEGDNIRLKPATANEVSLLARDLIGAAGVQKTNTALSLSKDGLVSLTCLLDVLKRRELENLILHVVGSEPIEMSDLEDELAIARENRDIRWLTPFFLDVFDMKSPFDLKRGLSELSNMGIVKLQKNAVEVQEEMSGWLGMLSGRKSLLGISSIFYHNAALQLLSAAFLRVGDYLYCIEGGEKTTWVSIDEKQLKETVMTLIAPGENPGGLNAKEEQVMSAEPAVAVEATEPAAKPSPKFCKYCGTPLAPGGKFCRSCGKPVGK
ncbi:hypothetical protein EAL2_c10350 [Peptoclostridium acidaminophilum DSM 3953]|uniref:Zinc-ribbon domain-containing protein n=1 Tax=Peptoclostridium acidaminophilum DSM 3953 TaxID=1286171 RepID=W8TES9_PEPAC|nr:zinc ribbon domain-containing protein [Peptoclostridium acidaminophilum]AHM56333.1 hypothetical protein EAL2_c10350 [Peptoclostridium acidaminophilum DSM 3953]